MPSKKRRIAAASFASGSPIENTRSPSSSRSTHEITTTRCRYGGRKSFPVCTRRFCAAISATSWSGRSSGSSCSFRIPATSGMVSMSNTSVGVIEP
jgi:hypothetical protein